MRYRYASIVSFLLLATVLYAQEASQWRGQYRNGLYKEAGLLQSWPADGPKLLWHYDNLGEGHASAAVVAHEKIYTAGAVDGKGKIFAFSLDGKLIWSTPYGDEWLESYPGSRSTPLINDGKVYLMSALGKIVCLSAEKGNLLWSVDIMKEYGPEILYGALLRTCLLMVKNYSAPPVAKKTML